MPAWSQRDDAVPLQGPAEGCSHAGGVGITELCAGWRGSRPASRLRVVRERAGERLLIVKTGRSHSRGLIDLQVKGILPWDVDLGTLMPVSFKYGIPSG